MTEQNGTPVKTRRTREPKQAVPASTPQVAAAPAAAPQVTSPITAKNPTKKDQLLQMLRQDCGATLAELVVATGWLPHTARAALTGLRKAGYVIDKGKRDELTCYRITAGA